MKYVATTAAVGLALMATVYSESALAASAKGSAAVQIVESTPLHIQEAQPFEYTQNNAYVAHYSTLANEYSPHNSTTTARSNSDPITWGEYNLTGNHTIQIAISNIRAIAGIDFKTVALNYGNDALKMQGRLSTAVQLNHKGTLRLGTKIDVKDSALSGHFQPSFDIALHYE